jgi:hypothetical protein
MERASTTARNSLIGPDLCFLRQPHIRYEARAVTDRNNDRSRLANAIKLHGDAVDARLAYQTPRGWADERTGAGRSPLAPR